MAATSDGFLLVIPVSLLDENLVVSMNFRRQALSVGFQFTTDTR